jgi:hypothetical protein
MLPFNFLNGDENRCELEVNEDVTWKVSFQVTFFLEYMLGSLEFLQLRKKTCWVLRADQHRVPGTCWHVDGL